MQRAENENMIKRIIIGKVHYIHKLKTKPKNKKQRK